jgi:hypothetical protein
MADNGSDLEAARRAVEKLSLPKGLQPEEIISAPEEVIPVGNAAVSGETVIAGLPGEAVAPLTANTLADGAAEGVPLASIGYVDQAGTFFSALIGGMTTAQLVLAGIAILGVAVAIGAAVYYGMHGGLSSRQAEAVVDQNRDPNSEESLRGMREASQANQASSGEATNPQANTATQQSSNPRYEVQESQETAKNSGGSFRSSPAGAFQENDAIVGKWSTRDSDGKLSNLGSTILKKGNGVFVAFDDAYPNFDGCAVPLLIHQTGASTYIGSNMIRPQGCYDNTSEFEVNGNRMTIKARLVNKLNDSDNTYHSTAERVAN